MLLEHESSFSCHISLVAQQYLIFQSNGQLGKYKDDIECGKAHSHYFGNHFPQIFMKQTPFLCSREWNSLKLMWFPYGKDKSQALPKSEIVIAAPNI